jgi:hypothetical protein
VPDVWVAAWGCAGGEQIALLFVVGRGPRARLRVSNSGRNVRLVDGLCRACVRIDWWSYISMLNLAGGPGCGLPACLEGASCVRRIEN